MDRRMKTIHAVQDNAENMRRFSKLSTSRKLRNFGLYHQVETSRRRLLIRALARCTPADVVLLDLRQMAIEVVLR